MWLTLCFVLCGDLISHESDIKSIFNSMTNIDNIYACPRCRRNLPKGPKKRPTPPDARSDRKKTVT